MIQCELNKWGSIHIEKMRSGTEISHSIRSVQERKKYEYIIEVYPNGSHQYERESHAEKFIYCRYIDSSPDSLPNWNCILICCGNFRKITIPEEESANSSPKKPIRFHIFECISKLSNHGILPIKNGKTCIECIQLNLYEERGKIYTNRGLALF